MLMSSHCNDWVSIFRRARRRLPYTVENQHRQDFYDLQRLAQAVMKNRRRDEDGNIVNWLLIKSLMYKKNEPGRISYRYNYADD